MNDRGEVPDLFNHLNNIFQGEVLAIDHITSLTSPGLGVDRLRLDRQGSRVIFTQAFGQGFAGNLTDESLIFAEFVLYDILLPPRVETFNWLRHRNFLETN